MKICVYLAASNDVDKLYYDAAAEMAKAILQGNHELVYGGANTGLMGRLADLVIAGDGKVMGVMPHFMKEVEWAHKGVKDFVFVDTMSERKAKFLEHADAVVALPGGLGTLEELLEAITLKKLGQFTKPIVIVNTKGYYAPLKAMLDTCVQEGFMHAKHSDMYTFVETPADVLPAIEASTEWNKDAIKIAAMQNAAK